MCRVTSDAMESGDLTSPWPSQWEQVTKWLLRMHSFASLYGWNLSGLAVICRKDHFPIRLHSQGVIAVHWATAIVLAPLGTYFAAFAVLSLIAYGFILYMILFSQGTELPDNFQ